MANEDMQIALDTLLQSGEYKILRRLPLYSSTNINLEEPLIGVVVDVETTGLNVETDEVIEIALIKFQFDRDGRIGKVLGSYQSFNEPTKPIPDSITELTGIKASDVHGNKISQAKLEAFLTNISIVVAHNAAFDRPFCESLCPRFSELSWACSATEIPWKSELISGNKLEYIAYKFNAFYDAHRASDDCNALLNILSFNMPKSHKLVLSILLENARKIETKIIIENSPFECRNILKKLGYRWSEGINGYLRGWWKNISDERVGEELEKLKEIEDKKLMQIHQFQMTAKTRFRKQN